MSTGTNGTPTKLGAPAETFVVDPSGEILLVIDGPVLLPQGARVELDDGVDVIVVGVRLGRNEAGGSLLILEVDELESSFEAAALAEAVAEAEVIEAAEEITAMLSTVTAVAEES